MHDLGCHPYYPFPVNEDLLFFKKKNRKTKKENQEENKRKEWKISDRDSIIATSDILLSHRIETLMVSKCFTLAQKGAKRFRLSSDVACRILFLGGNHIPVRARLMKDAPSFST